MIVNMATHDFTISGALHAQTIGAKPARSFDTTSAIWNDGQQKLTLDKPVIIHTGDSDPLKIASGEFDVKTGVLDIRGLSGPIR